MKIRETSLPTLPQNSQQDVKNTEGKTDDDKISKTQTKSGSDINDEALISGINNIRIESNRYEIKTNDLTLQSK